MPDSTDWPDWLTFVLAAVGAILVAIAAALTFTLIVRAVGRRRAWAVLLRRRLRLPLGALMLVILLWVATAVTLPAEAPGGIRGHVFAVLLVLAVGWFVGSLLVYFVDLGLAHYATDGSDGWQARRARTQFQILRRLTVVVTAVIAIGAALLTLPGVQAVGATVLASAGVLSVVAGLAAQSTLSNVFAGMQLAFSGAVRLEDIVVVKGAWGYIEEITLTYVVVRIWDERRLVLPSTYFTQQPYENWTRRSTAVLGTVFFDLDWGVDVRRMRAELDRILTESELWDGEASSLRVTDTVGGFVQVRALISAADAFAMFDLGRHVREEMLLWLQQQNPGGVPRTRIQAIERDGESFPSAQQQPGAADAAPHSNALQDADSGEKARPVSQGDETPPVSHGGEAPVETGREPR